jgi:hypothetical protein
MSVVPEIVQMVLDHLDGSGLDVLFSAKSVRGRQKYVLTFSSAPAAEEVIVKTEGEGKAEATYTAEQKVVYERLRILRLLIAKKEMVSAFIVYTNRMLEEMVQRAPTSTLGLVGMKGIGEVRIRRYGRAIVATIGGMAPEEAVLLCERATGTEVKTQRRPPAVNLDLWRPSRKILRYYAERDVPPKSTLGRWLAHRGYAMADVLAGKVSGVPPP